MHRQKLTQMNHFHSNRGHLGQPSFLKLAPKGIKIETHRQIPIWRKEKSGRGWKILFFLVCAIWLMVVSFSHASPPRSRGARPIALGNGYTAVSGDGYSLFYNPAGLHDIHQKEVIADFGRSYSPLEPARTDFNGILAMPYQIAGKTIPMAAGLYGEQPAPNSHIVDFSIGGALMAPVDQWSKGFFKHPFKGGLALTIRHQRGDDKSDRVGKSNIGVGLSGGFLFPIDRKHQAGVAVRHLFAGDSNPYGPSLNVGILREHKEYLMVMMDMEYARGGIFRFQPGLEWKFYRGVLRPRLGWGFRDNDGTDSVATGLGFYLSPIQIDVSYLIPVKTLSDNAGQFRASLRYRFGDPQFTEIYFDKALEAAAGLDKDVMSLSVREAELKSSLLELQQKVRLAQEELKAAKDRIELLKEDDVLGERDAQIRKLKTRVDQLESQLRVQRSENQRIKEKKATIRMHTVKAGDTLQSLAKEYYGDANQWKKIFNANPDKIDRGLPRVGAKLVIP